MNILFATPTPPLATKPRPHHFIRGLSRRQHQVHLLAQAPTPHAVEDPGSAPGWAEIAEACASVTWVVVPRWRSLAQCLASVPTRTPLRVAYCRSRHLRVHAEELIPRLGIDLLHVDRGRLAPVFAGLDVPKVLDATDSIALYLRQLRRFGPPGERLLAAAELLKMPRFEAGMADDYDACLVTSEADALALRRTGTSILPDVLPNGVDDRLLEAERLPESDTVLFVGNMSYAPNVDAAGWLVSEVLPRVREVRPRVRVRFVGHRPAGAVRRLQKDPGVEVTGTVAEIRPHLERAAVFVVPLRVGGGFSNKLMEALAAGVPTVATPAAREGLPDLDAGTHLLEADTPEAFASSIVSILGDRDLAERLGRAGRAFVRDRYRWDGVIEDLETVYGRARRR
jgi:polysaccharide biosynthesis protein PslH